MLNNKLILIIAVIVLFSGIVGFIFYNQNSTNSNSVPAENTSNNHNAVPDRTITEQVSDSNPAESMSNRYIEYTKGSLNNSSQNRRVLFFYASWCPTCRPVDIQFKENSDKIPQNTTVIRVNYNDPDTETAEKELAQKYGITYQHTFVQIDNEGNEVAKWNGGGLEDFLNNIK